MASPQALGELGSATQEEISPHLDELLKDVAMKLTAQELTNVVASIKSTFKGNFEIQQDQDLYSCLHLFAYQGLLSDENLTLLEKFVARKSSKKIDIEQRIESFKLGRQLDVTPRQTVKGRDIDLEAVLNKLAGKEPIINLYGAGGLGKTTLGKEICLKWQGRAISVDLRGVTEMKDVYFHVMLALDTERTIIKYEENPVVEALEMMKKESSVLLLLDNADQFSGGDDDRAKNLNRKLIEFLGRLVPVAYDEDKDKKKRKNVKCNEEDSRLKILLISRTRFGGLKATERNFYELKALDEGFSEEILQTTAGGLPNMNVNQMKKLVELCKGKPLYLNGIASILRQRIASAEMLLEMVEQELVITESHERDIPSEGHDTQERETWDSFSKGLDKEQLSCLRKMFFLLPSDTLRYSAVAVSLFCRPFSEEAAGFVLAQESSEAVILLEGLRNSKILSVDPDAKELLYDMHPLVRSFLRRVGNSPAFKHAYTEAKDSFCKLFMTKMKHIAAMVDTDFMRAFQEFDLDKSNFVLALNISFKSDYLYVSKEFQEPIMVYHLIEAMLEDTGQRKEIFRSWREAREEDGKEGSLFCIQMRCFEALQVLGLQGWKSATEVLKLAENSLKLVDNKLEGGESYRLARSTYLFTEGEIYYRKGSVPSALKSLYLSLEIMEDILKNHTSTTRCLNAIGNCYNRLGNADQALKFYTRAYEMRKELSGSKNHLDLPFFLGQIGTAYDSQKQYDKAIQCYQEALELSKELKLSGILRLALFQRNIANAYAWTKEFEKAYKPAMDAYEIRKSILGDHPDTARSAFQVAEISRSLEEYYEAEEFYEEAWRIEKSLEHGNHSAVRDRIIQSYTAMLSGDRKKEFQKEALEFYQLLWEEEKEFSYANKSIINEINMLVSASGDRKMKQKYLKEALSFYEVAWNSPDLQQLPYHEREEILRNVVNLSSVLHERELLKKYEGEQLRFFEQQWEENMEMTTQDKKDILHTLEHLAARQGDEGKRGKYKKLCEDLENETRFRLPILSPLSGSKVVHSIKPCAAESGGGNKGKTIHKVESGTQFHVLEETNSGALEQTSTNKCDISQGRILHDPEECDPGIQFVRKQEGPGEHKLKVQSSTSNEKGAMSESKSRTTTKAASSIITSEGGVVRVEYVQLLCPPGAGEMPVCIKITLEDPLKYYGTIVQTGLENDVMFAAPIIHLQPSGHLFKKPVTLTTKIKTKEGEVVRENGFLVLHGTEARDGKISWQDITQKSVISLEKKEVSVEIERFSFIQHLWVVTKIRAQEIVSRLNLTPFNYTMSVLFKENSSHHELALVFMSQEIFHEPYYKDDHASALAQLRNDGFKLLFSADGPTDKRIYNGESLKISVRLGDDYKLVNDEQSSVDVSVESHVWWSTGLSIKIPLEAVKDIRILCGRISIQGQHGHASEYKFCEQEFLGYVKRLLGVEGDIFNVKPIAEKIGLSDETMNQVMKSWRNEHDQLEILMQPWLKDTGDIKDQNSLRKGLEELKEEDYKVTQRGQMHIRHLRELAVKISDLKVVNAELTEYFTGKVQTLCDSVLRDCCVQVGQSVQDVERAASSQDPVNCLEVHLKLSSQTASKYQQMCSASKESIVKHFLAIVPQIIQDIKTIFHHEIMPDVQNGLRGLHEQTLDQLAVRLREARENNKARKLVCEVCKILEDLCMKNCDSQQCASQIHKWGSSLGVLSMLEFLKPFFQECPQDIRLHKRLELFACRIRDIMSDEVDVDEVFIRDFFDVSSSLLHFAKFDPTKLVRFHLTDSANSLVPCKREGLKYDSQNDTFSELFFLRKEEEEDLLLHAVALVHVKGRVCNVGAFQSVILLPASEEAAFQRCMANMSAVTVNGVAVAKQRVKESQHIRVVLCSQQHEELSLFLNNLRGELGDVVDWNGSAITPCHLTMCTALPTKPGTVLNLRLIYKWGSEALFFDSQDFALHADSSAEGACVPEVRFEGLRGSVNPEEAALPLLISDGKHLSSEPFAGSQRIQIHAQRMEYHLHQTYVTGHNCMIGDQTTLNTQTSTIDQRSLTSGPGSAPLRSITDDTSSKS